MISAYDIAATNGAPPASLKFGFAGSTGGVNNTHDISNLSVSTYTEAPVTAAVAVSLPSGSSLNLTGLSATDADGTIASFTITALPNTALPNTALPNAAQGTLFLGNPAGGVAVTAGQVLTPAQIGQLFFQAAERCEV